MTQQESHRTCNSCKAWRLGDPLSIDTGIILEYPYFHPVDGLRQAALLRMRVLFTASRWKDTEKPEKRLGFNARG